MNFVERADRVLSPVSGHYTQVEIERGEGVYLFDKQGQAYLDLTSGLGVCSTGHCHPEVVAAISDQASKLIHACIGVVYYDPPISLGEKLGQILGPELSSFFFTNSGSEAMETAIKLAKYVTKKHKLVAFSGGFHGRTLGALSVTTSKQKYREGYAPLLEGVSFFEYPYCYRCPFGKERQTCGVSCREELNLFFDQLDDEVAAVIIEPILGEGGYVAAPSEFMQELARLCKAKGILLILDEIQSGFAKTGSWFAFQQLGIQPDIVTLAKGIGSGLPLGACAARPELMAKWTKSAHGGTYGGNPVCARAGLATLDVLTPLLPSVSLLGEIAIRYLEAELQNHPYIGEIRGYGMMIGLEFVKDKSTRKPAADYVNQVMKTCLDQKVIVISCGLFDNVIRLIPALVISEEEWMAGLKVLVEAIHGLS